jgi:transposase
MLGKALGRKGLAAVATIASPETILRWYRELVAKNYDGSQQRRHGRPKTSAEIVALVVRMAKENERWGYTRIMGALKNLGHEIGRNTIKRILLENGIDPAPERGRRMSWATFIKEGLDNDLISPAKATNGVGKVSRRGRLGGLLSFYYREAA